MCREVFGITMLTLRLPVACKVFFRDYIYRYKEDTYTISYYRGYSGIVRTKSLGDLQIRRIKILNNV